MQAYADRLLNYYKLVQHDSVTRIVHGMMQMTSELRLHHYHMLKKQQHQQQQQKQMQAYAD